MSIKAKYSHPCTLCGISYSVGDLITDADDLGWHHVECPTDDSPENHDDSPWDGCESVDEHDDHGQGYCVMTRRGIEYLVCAHCEKEFLRHGRKLGEGIPFDFLSRDRESSGHGEPVSDPWGVIK